MKLPELLTALLTVIVFTSCNKEEEPQPQIVTVDPIEITTNQICVSKTYVMHDVDTVVYDEQCFTVDTAYINDDRIGILFSSDEFYSVGMSFEEGLDTNNIKWPAILSNSIPITWNGGSSITAQQCSEGAIIITKDSANMVSGTFYGSGWVYQQDTLFSVSGSFDNVVYR